MSQMCRTVLLSAFLSLAGVAAGDVTVVTDRDVFNDLVGEPDFLEDFEGFADDVEFAGGITFAPDGFALRDDDPGTALARIDVAPFEVRFSGFPEPSTTDPAVVVWFSDRELGTPFSFSLVLDAPATAVGFDLTTDDFPGAEVLAFDAEGNLLATLTPALDGFVGFVGGVDGPIASLDIRVFEFRAVDVVIDNVAGVFVPGPGAGVVLGFAGVLAARRRRG